MKKIFIILAITFGCILNLGGVKAALRGDVNGDGKVDRNDYTLLFRFTSSASVQGEGLNSKEKKLVKKNGDVNGDGSINDQDSEELMVLIRIDEDSQTYNNLNKETVSCGSGMISGVPSSIPKAVNIVYTVLQIVVPIIIVILGMIDLIKAVIASKEDEIKKAQMTFIKRLIAGALVFFVFVVVKLLVSVVADNSTSANKIIDCADCFLNGIDNCKVSKGG